MGVPKLFKIILERFPKSHSLVSKQYKIDYLFIDFNSLIYEGYADVRSSLEGSGMSKNQIEKKIIDRVIFLTNEMIRTVSPNKFVYLALDGPPPRGKMIEQRNRRYKKTYYMKYASQVYDQFNLDLDPVWDTTAISPGTEFMQKVSERLGQAIMNGRFPSDLEYVLSDSNVPGEGEHKFLPYLDALEPSNVCLSSNDGDILILVHRFPQHRVHILTKPRETFFKNLNTYANEKYMYVHMSEVDQGLGKLFGKLPVNKYNPARLKRDFSFFTMLGGNDFVKNLFFLKMKEQHTPRVMIGIYQALVPKYGYLVDTDFTINQDFLEDYLHMLGRQEWKWLKEVQKRYQNHKPSKRDRDGGDNDLAKPWDKELEIFEHTPYYKKDHPQFKQYKKDFYQIDFNAKPNVWKPQYYKTFFNIDYKNKKEVGQICFQYLKSWFYCFNYYFLGLPSWRWYYPHQAAPLPSDMVHTVRRIKDINKVFQFNLGQPFKPLEQLMLILPPDSYLLPKELRKVQKGMPQFYPKKFDMEVLWGQKFIYAEPDLPKINAKTVLAKVNKVKLSAKDKKLNVLNKDPLYYSI